MSELSPDQAAVILAVARWGTTVEAARRLHRTQSAVSKAVSRCEGILGIEIFERAEGRLRVRPEAASLLLALEDVAAQWRQWRSKVSNLQAGTEPVLRIAATPSLGQGIVARTIAALLAVEPDAQISLVIGDPLGEIAAGRADVGFMFSPRVGDDIVVRPIAAGTIVALVRDDDPFVMAKHVDLRALCERRLICFDRAKSPLGFLIAAAFEKVGLTYAPTMTVPYSISAALLVRLPRDIALVDNSLMSECSLGNLTELPVAPAIPIAICMLTPRTRPVSRLARRFTQLAVARDKCCLLLE